jgi:cell division protein FtsW
MRRQSIDRPLALLIGVLVIGGALIFASAAFGLLARGATHMSSVAFSHLVLGVGLGLVSLCIGAVIDYRIWRRYAPHLFIFACAATALVFLPGLGFSHGGGTRWLHVGSFSVQPAEGIKLAAVMLSAAYFSLIKSKVSTFTYGFGGFLAILAVPTILLLLQPDTGTLGIIAVSVAAVFFAAGASWKQITAVLLIGLISLGLLATFRPYVRDRIVTFFNPTENQQEQSYQLRQSLIAIGSGGVAGRGFGQGIQKFTYLPEPMGDSIFAVAAEELGFIGSSTIVLLFLAFALRGYRVATHAPDMFGSLLAVGIATYLASEAFVNIASMLGALPLTGVPLTFVSQGGSAMLVSLGSAGILLAISRRRA